MGEPKIKYLNTKITLLVEKVDVYIYIYLFFFTLGLSYTSKTVLDADVLVLRQT